MFPRSDALESLLEGDGVSGSPKAGKGLPEISRVALGGVVGVLSTIIEGISAATHQFCFFLESEEIDLVHGYDGDAP